MTNPKQIADPDNEGQMIDNPDFDPTKNEDGTPVVPPVEPKDELAPIKAKLDKAFEERDRVAAENAALKKQIRDAELAKLKEDGKTDEHYQALISDKDAEIVTLKQTIVELTRDNAVHKELSGYTFRNDKAASLAYDSVVKELVQDDKGIWVHKSGKSINDFVKAFAEDEENTFLFKTKENRGSGLNNDKPTPPSKDKTSLFKMSQKDVLELAAKKKLPVRK